MPRTLQFALAAVLLAWNCLNLSAQTAASPKAAVKETHEPSNQCKECLRAAETLSDLFEISKGLPDQTLKTEIDSQIADALWNYDQSRARRIFIEAFQSISDEPASVNSAVSRPPKPSTASQLRERLIALISQHDPILARTLVQSLVESANGSSADAPALYSGIAANAAGTDLQTAVAMSQAALAGGITPAFINSLNAIQAASPSVADGIFYQALAVAGADTAHFGQDLSLLASYLFASQAGLAASPDLSDDPDAIEAQSPSGPSIGLVNDFLNFALQKALAQTPGQPPPGLTAYVQLMQLLPYYQQYMPDVGGQILAQFNHLAAAIPDSAKSSMISNLVGQNPTGQIVAGGNSLGDPEKKDLLYERAALQAINQEDLDHALKISGLITNAEIRSRIESTAYEHAAGRAFDRKDLEAAYRYALQIPQLRQQTPILAQITRAFLARKADVRAGEVLDQAERITANADDGLEKARSLLLLSDLASQMDKVRGSAILQLAVVAINRSETPKSPAKDKLLSAGSQKTKPLESAITPGSLNLRLGFGTLARADFESALAMAQSIARPEISMLAQVAVCRGELQKSFLTKRK